MQGHSLYTTVLTTELYMHAFFQQQHFYKAQVHNNVYTHNNTTVHTHYTYSTYIIYMQSYILQIHTLDAQTV